MKVLYLNTTAPPKLPGTDALHNTIDFLAERFGAEKLSLYPLRSAVAWYPRSLYGLHNFRKLVSMARASDVVHVFSPTPVWYPVLNALPRKPVVLSVVAGAPEKMVKSNLKNYAQILVSNERDKASLAAIGDQKVKLVFPGIDTSHIRMQPQSSAGKLHLLMASAPWSVNQFMTKGIDLLIQLIEADQDLEITFLWRNVLVDVMKKRLAQLPKSSYDRIHLINKKVDISNILKDIDAVTLLAQSNELVKAFPHSLVEGLAAGKPVLVSRTIAMADYVEKTRCGLVVERFDLESLQERLAVFRLEYDDLRKVSSQILAKDFGLDRYMSSLRNLYTDLITET